MAKSIPAKKYDIQTGEPIVSAQKKCPELVVLPPDYHLYVMASRALMDKLNYYSDNVTQYSIDEAWAEFSGYRFMYGGIVEFANQLREEIKNELGFTVNIGVSTNKLLAKMAGDFKKPDRVHTLFPWEIEKKMWPLPVGDLFFVGRATQKKLNSLGIMTIGELAKADLTMFRSHMKSQADIVWNYAWGKDLVPYIYHQETNKGYGNSMTAPSDVRTVAYARQIFLSLSETIGMRLRADDAKVSCLSVSICTCEFERFSKQMQLLSATDVTEEIYENACNLFDTMWHEGIGSTPIRQLGIHTSKVSVGEYRQFNLFDTLNYEKLAKMNRAVDAIRSKYGEGAVVRARFIQNQVKAMGGGLSDERRTGITTGIRLDKELQKQEG